jgi:hypothetical protein
VYNVSYGPTSLTLTVPGKNGQSTTAQNPEPLGGDFNGSGVVDQADLDLVLLRWGQDPSSAPDNWVNNRPAGQIDQNELDAVLLNWGAALPVAAASNAPPIPTAPRETATGSAFALLPQLEQPLPAHARDFAFDAFPPAALDHLFADSLT